MNPAHTGRRSIGIVFGADDLPSRNSIEVSAVTCEQSKGIPDGASRDSEIVCRNDSARSQAGFYLSAFPAKLQIVRSDDKALQMPLQRGDAARSLLPYRTRAP